MDAEYFDLYVKFVGKEEEVCWYRRCYFAELYYYLQFFKEFNRVDLKLNKKSRIEYVRIE